MICVYKYRISPYDETKCEVPFLKNGIDIASQTLHVDIQDECPVVWVMVDPSAPKREVVFKPIMTGETADNINRNEHVGTLVMFDGRYVIHVFAKESNETND